MEIMIYKFQNKNPFLGAKDINVVWKEILQNARVIKKEDFLKKINIKV